MMFDARHNTSKVWDPEQVWDIVVRQIVFLERKAFHSRIAMGNDLGSFTGAVPDPSSSNWNRDV
jgi:hypothetical protein